MNSQRYSLNGHFACSVPLGDAAGNPLVADVTEVE
jgi:hypothetical protein